MATGGVGVRGRNRFFASRCSASCGALGGASPLAGGYAPLCSPVRHLHCAPLCAAGLLQRAIRAHRLRPAHFLAFRLPTCPRFLASFGSSPPSRNRPRLSSWPFFPTTPAVLSPWTLAVSRSVRVPVSSPVFVTLKKGAGSKGYRSSAAIMSDSPGSSDPACLIDGKPELPIQVARKVVYICKEAVLQQALKSLSLEIHESRTCSVGNNQMVGSICIAAPTHGPYSMLHNKTIYGDYKSTEEYALESARIVALLYLQKIGVIFVDDINQTELTNCEAKLADCQQKLFAASNWADIFQGQAESLKAKLAIAYEENEKLMKQAKAYNIKKEVLQTQATDVKKEIPTLPLFNVGKDSSTPPPFNNTADARSLQSEMEAHNT